ncbi:MAG TPA: adenylyl-sulfate kinase [Elusimicrobia bacterium]|nr:adenylyl-sulfate kinase [Elusimicrobiota bacterium]
MSEGTARPRLPIVVAGHVDHGKSTVVGRLLADTGSLPQGKLEQIRSFCERNSKPFEYAFLLDALKDEQSQGITIDFARIFFKTALRDYLIFDAPGHIEFLKNMVSGASHASAALLVVDAREGVRENTRRHGTMLSMLGVRQIAVLINKMDLVDWKEDVFRGLCEESAAFLAEVRITPAVFIPISGLEGVNIAGTAAQGGASGPMPWYRGPTLIEALDRFAADRPAADLPFRMPVQEVYKFTKLGDHRRIIAGTIDSGSIRAGDELVFYPSGKTARVATLEGFPASPAEPLGAGRAVGFTLSEQIYVRRGELAAKRSETAPKAATRFRASVFWLGKAPLQRGREYVVKLGSARVKAQLESVQRVLDASTLKALEGREDIGRHEVAECVFTLRSPIACDRAEDNVLTGRFVIVDGYEIRGGGLVLEALQDPRSRIREKVILRNIKWQKGLIPREQRETRHGQRASLVVVTGADDELRKAAARSLEAELYEEGRYVYFLGIGSVLYGVDADIRGTAANHEEDIRRLAEVANILLDCGLIVVVTASELCQSDWDVIRTAVEPERTFAVWLGRPLTTDLRADLDLQPAGASEAVDQITAFLQAQGVLPRD